MHDGDSEIVVRLGQDATGEQILLSEQVNHISVWCEEFSVDFGNAALECDDAAAPAAADPAESPTAPSSTASEPCDSVPPLNAKPLATSADVVG